MCGIAGFVGGGTREQVVAMTDALEHRGPDDSGIEVRGDVGFGHRRLSIIDTSARGHQPMLTPDERCMVVFNGEIYNFAHLRKSLEKKGHAFEGGSDTEVLLHLYDEHGERFLDEATGMFALALYDFQTRTLILARDRFGEKPLYWAQTGETLYFASEMQAMFASRGIAKTIDMRALSMYLALDYVPTPYSILEGVHKLEPATMLIATPTGTRKRKFWSPPERGEEISEDAALAELDTRLSRSVSRQLVSDVPLGIFLSGGLDSSTVAYYAQQASRSSIETFAIGFDEPSFDESSFAREVAAHVGTHHHEHVVRSSDALALVPSLADTLSEPMADASIIPTLLLSSFTRSHVTVALGGDGGDELFAGYPTFLAERAYGLYATLPAALRSSIRALADRLPVSHGNLPLTYQIRKFVDTDAHSDVRRHLEWLGTFSRRERAELLQSSTERDAYAFIELYAAEVTKQSSGNALLYAYMRSYLMDQVLVKVDRASMRHALEVRAPFLDHELAAFVMTLPYELKYHGRTSKYLLKKLMRGKLQDNIIDRKKKGFGVPLAAWLTGPLRPLMEELLSAKSLKRHGLFQESYVQRLVDDHVAFRRDNRKELWNLMVFQLWYNRWMK